MKFLFVTPYLYQDVGIVKHDLSQAWRNPPLNVVLLASWLNKHGHESRIADLQRELIYAHGDKVKCFDSLAGHIRTFMPDVVGFSFFSVHTPEMFEISTKAREICESLRIKPIFIAGGIHPTIEPEATLQELDVDYVCIGEGEIPLLALAEREEPERIAGITSLSQFNTHASQIVKDLDSLPFPDYALCDWKLYSAPTYLRVKKYVTSTLDLMLGRGCAFSCNFCAYKAMSSVRFHSADYFLDMVDALNKSTGIADFYIIDSTIGTNKKLLVELCEKAIARGFAKRYRFLANMRADQVTKELLALMQRAGFIYLFYGFESGSQDDLDRINKKTKISDNYHAAQLHNELNFLYNASMLMNYPGQTVSDLCETEKFLQTINAPSVGINIYTPLPGCHDYDSLKSHFVLPSGRYDWRAVSQSAFTHVFAAMTKDELFHWKERLEKVAAISEFTMPKDEFLIEDLRDKWREVPGTRQERIFSSDAMKMNDGQLLEWWEQCRAETCGPEVRGWYQSWYKNIFRGKIIADIGPGIGLDGIFFIENGVDVTFVDIHRDNLALLERICKLKGLEAKFYYIDNFESYDFSNKFDGFLAIGSLINAPFDFTQKQVSALASFLKPGGMVLWLGYPYERFIASGSKDGAEFGKTTDGERTPWIEWYDRAKILRLWGNEFTASMEVNFGAEQIEFNVFQLDHAAAYEGERALFSKHPLAGLSRIKQSALQESLAIKLPSRQWAGFADFPVPPEYDDLDDARVLRYLYRNFAPARHLEFGTWKGKGVRRVLDECENASVWTINLWEGEYKTDGSWAYSEPIAEGAQKGSTVRTDAAGMIGIEYLQAGLGNRVNQIYSDSRLWNDLAYPDGFFDSVFVDGGHDAATSRADLYKALRLLRPGGLLLLHDFCPKVEVTGQFPSTVGVTSMVADELENIATMCDDFFWIEDTWLFCGIRSNKSIETRVQQENKLMTKARETGKQQALATKIVKQKARGTDVANLKTYDEIVLERDEAIRQYAEVMRQRDKLLRSRWRRIGLKFGLTKKLPIE